MVPTALMRDLDLRSDVLAPPSHRFRNEQIFLLVFIHILVIIEFKTVLLNSIILLFQQIVVLRGRLRIIQSINSEHFKSTIFN